jgi:glucokinase
MLLAGDIGATKTNLALYSPESGLTPLRQATFLGAEYTSLEAVCQAFLVGDPTPVETAVFGVAGPIFEGEATVTNLPWVIREATLEQVLGLQEATLLNDLEATAYGVPHLSPADLYILNDAPPRSGTKGVIAPGTGLGEAVLLYHGGHYHVLASEGGHTDFGPKTPFEIGLLRYLMDRFDHVSYERICSGIGLPNLYAYIWETRTSGDPPPAAEAYHQAPQPTRVIIQKAMSGESELCMEALNAFVSILGAEAGNLALKVMASGGIYLGGGIPPRILPKLKDGTFMAAFVRKGRFSKMLSEWPVYVILRSDTALLGAAAYGLGL